MRRSLAVVALVGACSSFEDGTDVTPPPPDGGPTADAGGDSPTAPPDSGSGFCAAHAGAIFCTDFEDGLVPSALGAQLAEVGVDEESSTSPTHSLWARSEAADAGQARAFVANLLSTVPPSFELAFSLRLDVVPSLANAQVEVARVNLTATMQIEILFDGDAGGKLTIIERDGCKASDGRFPSSPTLIPVGALTWHTVQLVVTPMAAPYTPDGGRARTHHATLIVDTARVIENFELCVPTNVVQGALRYGIETGSGNPPSAWALRFDDIVFFAR